MEIFIISIDMVCHIYFLIVHMMSIFGLTSTELNDFQISQKSSINFLKYLSQLFHFGFVLVFSVSNGIRCSKYFSKNDTQFRSKIF